MSGTIPAQVKKYFWGDDLAQLNWQDHQQYITQTLLERGGKQSISWLFDQVSRKDVQKMLPSLKLSPKSRNFWEIYLS